MKTQTRSRRKKKAPKFKEFVFVKTAGCTNLNLTLERGTKIKVYRNMIEVYGARQKRVPEIELFIRDGVLMPVDSPEAEAAIGATAARAQRNRQVTTPSVDTDGVERVRGLEIARSEQDVVREIPIEPREDNRRSARARTSSVPPRAREDMEDVGNVPASRRELGASDVKEMSMQELLSSGKKKTAKSRKVKSKKAKASGKAKAGSKPKKVKTSTKPAAKRVKATTGQKKKS